MQTAFRPEQLRDPAMRESERILRSCVHCGFCTATCPTYVLLGDELDSPRGRIYLIKNMLEREEVTPAVVRHVDRCLSCLSCMSTCPSGVDYMHLVDHARSYIERHYRRPPADRLLRALIAWLLPRPALFRLSLLAAVPLRPLARLLPPRLEAMLRAAPERLPPPSPVDRPQRLQPRGRRRARVAVLPGCAQQVLAPEINEATVRLLLRMGVEVVVARGAVCCGALTHHMGKEGAARRSAARTIRAWWREHRHDPLDFVVVNASGCGTTVKDYAHMFPEGELAQAAAEIAARTRDVHEVLAELELPPSVRDLDLTVAWHAPCSLQHGQRLAGLPARLLAAAGFTVRTPLEAHLCCGSAGTYSLLQPELAARLQARKAAQLEATGAAIIASANIGCIAHIRGASRLPVVHGVELLDWVTGGPPPPGIAELPGAARAGGAEAALFRESVGA